ncbi:M50 family metallopeptidase [Alkalihalobacterium chitinilyticum]|uniref:M50 family metallopeptidase n=1 Tax=Alkalihalobacterium chitinilyticum TaxID=2980103 RepID=A0ABT5VFJ8_9BACI|nr:M50 family metallopeptidase [Alkalihalobacterium chitinilyticum]MDE5413233.1 M50 family metallopeptidase [Alkalihalobacterium chitinilyticum]
MKKQLIKKYLIFIAYMLIGAIAGGGIAYSLSSIEFPSEYRAFPFYVNLLIVACTYFMAVAFHEFGHAYSFSRNGVKVRAVIVMFLFFIKENGRWKVKFRPNKLTAIGGIAIPDIRAIKDQADLEQTQRAYARAIIAGPVSSIMLWAGVTVLSVLLFFTAANAALISTTFTVMISLTIITLFLLATSFIKNEYAVGDFPAYKLAKNDRFFIAMQLYQYALFSTEHERVRNENQYLRTVLLDELEKKLQERDNHIYTLGLVDHFIIEYLTGRIEQMPSVIVDYVDYLQEDEERLAKIKANDFGLSIYFHILRYMYTKEETKQKALNLYENLKSELKPNTPMRKYLLKQADHAFGLADHSEFLQNKENICISPAHDIWKNFEGYFVDELTLNQLEVKKVVY